MAPSATESVQQVTEQIHEKIVPVKEDAPKTKNGYKIEPADELEDLPELRTDHKEPLKLSGALDQFVSFDVTPVIGREFVNVDLAKWLRAPNSDELLRDLAITSMCYSRILTICPSNFC